MALNTNKREGDKLHAEEWNELVQEVQGKQSRLNIVDALDSTSSTDVLSAKQGNILNNKIEDTKTITQGIETVIKTLPIGYFYGTFTIEEELPSEISEKGYAYVGNAPNYVIYTYEPTIGWSITNNKYSTPTLETDLETKSQTKAPTTRAVQEGIEAIDVTLARSSENENELTKVQKFNASANINDRGADIVQNTGEINSLGYKILNPNEAFASQITTPNTIYEVRDKFDLGSQTVVLGSNITLNFNGGKIVNGTIKGDKTIIKSASYQIFDNITFSGNFINTLNASWIGAKEGDTTFDNSFVIQQWFNSYSTVFKTLEFDYGSYTFKTPVTLNTDTRNLKILGNNSLFKTIIPDDGDNGQCFITLQGTLQGSSSGGENFALESIRFSNNNGTLSKTRCIMLNRTQRFSIKDVYISYYDVAIWIRNCFYGGFYGSVALVKNRIGVYADSSDTSTESITTPWHEVNGIDFHNININGCTIEEAKTLWIKKDGESEDAYNMRVAVCGIDFHAACNGCKFYGITLEHLNYGIRFSYKPYTTTQTLVNDVVTIDSCYFEAIDTYAIYSGKGYINNPNSLTYIFKIIHNIVISNCRFASNQAIYLKYGNTYFLNNQIASIMLDGDYGGNTYLVYNGAPNVNVGSYCAAHKTDVYFGQNSLYTNSYQQLNNLVRSRGHITTATLDLSRSSNYNNNDPIFIEEGSLGISPTYRIGDIIYPCSIKKYNKDIYARVSIRSGASEHLFLSGNTRETLNIKGTRLRTFISDWLAPDEDKVIKTYSSVEGLWPFEVKSDPIAGLVKKVSDNTVVGFGAKAIEDGNVPTFSSSTNYCIFIEGLIRVVFKQYNGSKYCVYYNDVVECGRTYREVRPNPESGTTNSVLKAATKVFGTTVDLASVQKRINAIYYDTTEHKTKIFNGTAWVDLTNPWDRYFYNDIGNSLVNRPEMAEYDGQEFYNKATGIKYTFNIAEDKLSYSWRSSVGDVSSLEHPNGYDASNHLTYATELTAGECVICNGKLYSWNGSAWLDANGEPAGLQVSDTSVLIDAADNSSTTINVYHANALNVTALNPDNTSATWLTVPSTVAVGTNTLTITAAANTASNPRGAKVIIEDGTDVVIVNVVQNYTTT